MTTAHTAGQLGDIIEIDPFNLSIDWPVIDERHECGSDHYPVTVTSGDPDELRANAERVRLCWNAHDDLVKALVRAANFIQPFNGHQDLLDEIDAALAKAGAA